MPTPERILNDAEHWRKRAEEAATIADGIQDAESRRRLLLIADEYMKLAERAEERRKQKGRT